MQLDHHQLTLADGRTLGYRDIGDPKAPAVIFNAGFMGCRLTGQAATGARVITADRPGIGLSTAKPDRSVLGWADDVKELADHLGLPTFAVLGHSAGGPYAAACAHRLGDRITALGLACSFAPWDRPGATEGINPRMAKAIPNLRRAPWLIQMFMFSLPRQYKRDPDKAFQKQFGRDLPECDTRALRDTTARNLLLSAAVECTRQGSKPIAVDARLLFAAPWGFEPSAISVPTHLWYGADDTLTPLQMGRYLDDQISGSTLTVYDGEGHMAAFTHWSEIVTTLVNGVPTR